MGEIIYWLLIRMAVVILALWYISENFYFKFFWTFGFIIIYLAVFHPAYVKYKKFIHKNKPILEDTLCSKCKHFDETAVLCMKHDKHPDENFIPCEGEHWDPK